MTNIDTLFLIAVYTGALLGFAYLICNIKEAEKEQAAEVLRYQGVLYIGANDKPIDCYRHTLTGAVYYKQGLQYRSAITGRIVATQNALNGTY